MAQSPTDDVTNIELEINGETFRSGTSTGRRLVPAVVNGDDESNRWLELTQRVISKERTGSGIQHRLDDEGDRITLGELLERNGLDVADLERERRLSEFDVVDKLNVGDVVEIERLHNGEPKEPERGVIRAIKPGDDFLNARAEITWNGHTWSVLENTDGDLRIGRGNMMGDVHDVRIADPNGVDDADLLGIQEAVIDSADLDEKAAEMDVSVESTWRETTGEGTDLHARVTVTGSPLTEPVSVHCRNIFDFGWTAHVDVELDEETEKLVTRAARNNSPITTGVRL